MSKQTIDLRPLQEWADGFAERMAKVVDEVVAARAARDVLYNQPDEQTAAPTEASMIRGDKPTCAFCGEKIGIYDYFSYRGFPVGMHRELDSCVDALRQRAHPLESHDNSDVSYLASRANRLLRPLATTDLAQYPRAGEMRVAIIIALRKEVEEIEEIARKATSDQTAAYTPDAYQQQALRTWAGGKDKRDEVQHAALGLGGEVGEFLDLIKKSCYKPGYILSPEKAKDELADVVYYVLVMAHLWGFTFQDMMDHLAVKLDDGHGWVAK